MRRIVLLMVVGLVVVAIAVPVVAITNGTEDDGAHPSVGGLVASEAYSDGTWIYCSGTLISETVFLTAAHCGDDGASVTVTFDTKYMDEDDGDVYTGTFHADPVYAESYRQNDPHDIAVVVFDEPVVGITPSDLPEAGSLSGLDRGQSITSVGYGAYDVSNAPGGKVFLYDDVRMVSEGRLKAVNKAWLRISMNPATGDGGTCYGDSGGPNFLGNSNVIAATTITGDAVCRATNVTYRLDTPSARDFLGKYVALP
jgi:V8-like Glu-specific endopeptidase